MIGAVYSFLLLLAGYVLIFLGIAFINKLFIPTYLDAFYAQTGFLLRTLIMCLVFAFPANLVIAQGFNVTSASIAGPMLIAVVVLLSIANAMVLDKVVMTWPVAGATSAALFFCCLTAWLLEGQRMAG